MNVHTIKDGRFIRTLLPVECTGPSIDITFLTLSYQGKFIESSRFFRFATSFSLNFPDLPFEPFTFSIRTL